MKRIKKRVEHYVERNWKVFKWDRVYGNEIMMQRKNRKDRKTKKLRKTWRVEERRIGKCWNGTELEGARSK